MFGGRSPRRARAARRPPSPRSVATSASCAASAVVRVVASKEAATRQVCSSKRAAACGGVVSAKWPCGSMATARAPARPARIPARVAGGTTHANTMKGTGGREAKHDRCGGTWSQRATASRWRPTHCMEVAWQLPLLCALKQRPECTNSHREVLIWGVAGIRDAFISTRRPLCPEMDKKPSRPMGLPGLQRTRSAGGQRPPRTASEPRRPNRCHRCDTRGIIFNAPELDRP